MKRARLRALIHFKMITITVIRFYRNEESPFKGIDTLLQQKLNDT